MVYQKPLSATIWSGLCASVILSSKVMSRVKNAVPPTVSFQMGISSSAPTVSSPASRPTLKPKRAKLAMTRVEIAAMYR